MTGPETGTGPASYPPYGYLVPFDCALVYGLSPIGECDWGDCDREVWGMRWDGDTRQYLTVCEHCARTYDPSMAALRETTMQAHFERLREQWDVFVAALPLLVRVWARTIGPYGIRLFRRRP